MLYLTLPSTIHALSIYLANVITANPVIVREIGTHMLLHSMRHHARVPRGMSRVNRGNLRLRRRAVNQRHRWFVDNIIMHHRRLHEKNRQIAINNSRNSSLLVSKKPNDPLNLNRREPLTQQKNWGQRVIIQNGTQDLRNRIESRRIRAKTRWLTIEKHGRNLNLTESEN